MAWYGVKAHFLTESLRVCVIYWSGFLFLLVVTFLLVALDIRFIRLQYALERRELLRDVLEDEPFRKALIGAQRDEAHAASSEKPPSNTGPKK